MTLSEQLRALRRGRGWSQEQLAERLGVSRQAVTKWETDSGTPEVENLLALAGQFGVTVDALLAGAAAPAPDFAYESTVEYDIDEPKRFDLNLGAAKKLILSGGGGEKLRVRLASDDIASLESGCKVKVDDGKRHLDVDLVHRDPLHSTALREGLTILLQLPDDRWITRAELAVHADAVEIRDLSCEQLELSLKGGALCLERVAGNVTVDCNHDLDITCKTLDGALSVNQLSAVSRLHLPAGAAFTAVNRGRGTVLRYEAAGKPAEPFDTPDAPNRIELNGFRSELTLCKE